MPLFEFTCQDCGQTQEVLIRSSQPESTAECEECKGTNLTRLPAAGSFHLKGSGWFKDLYSSTNKDKK